MSAPVRPKSELELLLAAGLLLEELELCELCEDCEDCAEATPATDRVITTAKKAPAKICRTIDPVIRT
jgi:hypothetical protein